MVVFTFTPPGPIVVFPGITFESIVVVLSIPPDDIVVFSLSLLLDPDKPMLDGNDVEIFTLALVIIIADSVVVENVLVVVEVVVVEVVVVVVLGFEVLVSPEIMRKIRK